MKDLTGLFNPKSVAVIGASNQEGKIGYIVVDNLKKCGYPGEIYPVNTKADGEILGLKAYKSVLDIPGDVDLVVM